MSIDLGTETVALAVKERTWRVEIFTDLGADPTIRAHREKVWLRPDGSCAQRLVLDPVERRLSVIAAQAFKVGAATYTGAELARVIGAVADVLRQEDIAAAAAAAAQLIPEGDDE